MGYYINPVDMEKEEWLTKNALSELNKEDLKIFNFNQTQTRPVCLLNNGFFTAAGIAFNERELNVFASEEDTRPKKFYEVEVKKILNNNIGLTLEDKKNLKKLIGL